MDTSNIVTAAYNATGITKTGRLWQWSKGQTLVLNGFPDLPTSFEMYYQCADGTPIQAKREVGTNGEVAIPNDLVANGSDINAWMYIPTSEDVGTVVYKFVIPIQRRPMPEGYTVDEVQINIVDQAIAALNDACTTAAQYAGEAKESADDAALSASAAENSETAAAQSEENAEAWAVGQRDGVDVPDTDPTYHNNSKWYADQAAGSASEASGYADNALTSAGDAADSAHEAYGYATDAENAADLASGSKDDAAASASNAATSESNALTYKGQAQQYASDAAASESAASGYASDAMGYANAASGDASDASGFANAASGSASAANTSALDSEAYAVGQRNGADVPSGDPAYHNNAKYYSEQIGISAEDAEAWAVGQRGGVDVPNTDPTYQNNSKYWASQANSYAQNYLEAFAQDTVTGLVATFPDGAKNIPIVSALDNDDDSTTVTYRADTALYVTKRLAALNA